MTGIRYIDSHTAGEPTRVVLSGFPELPGDTLAAQREALAGEYRDWARRVNTEPRGHDVLVSALLLPPRETGCVTGVIFFNTVGPLGMCGHGTIGVVATLAYMGQIGPGEHRIETPVGVVSATLHPDGRVSVANVPAYRHLKEVALTVPGVGVVRGDVAWGGNWFYLVDMEQPGLGGAEIGPERVEALMELAWAIRGALEAQGLSGRDGAVIDHIELMGRAGSAHRNFVLCPGRAYDRSPCGTGTSAKLACLAADGRLAPGEVWHQESVIGSAFEGTYRWQDGSLQAGAVLPVITGQAYITGVGELIVQDGDPFAWGIPRAGG